MSDTRIIKVAVPKDRRAHYRRLHNTFLREAKRCDQLEARLRTRMANAANSLLGMMSETDKISGPFDWELGRSVLLNYERGQIVIENPTLKASIQMETEPNTAEDGRRAFTGINRESGKPVAKFTWNPATGWFDLKTIHQEKWERESAESIVRFLHTLNNNRETENV